MFDDLVAASSPQGSPQSADPYFLGSIVLVKEEQDPLSEVVDGQQRLTTLTILLSILRRHVSAAFVGSVEKRFLSRATR